ncbi:hypothetical protein [Streptomyces sp. NBC_00094]|uniref:hypothetical protein n=1 Tax=Streptomyces sp. NBC_00094 TaxID=2903620 RepID=UPI0022510545|nr:hypothetical protein [Streptomyces sp. NBC_00094]MCX5394212.1 hypothetical protein [Streptomyces sp. NBC_00094]
MDQTWRWIRALDAPAIDWEKEGDEWLNRVAQHLYDPLKSVGHGIQRDVTTGLMEFSTTYPNGERTDTRILILPIPDGAVKIWLSGLKENEDPTLSAIWEDAIKNATEGVSEEPKKHKWTALIGATPPKYDPKVLHLAKNAKVDNLSLSSTGRYYIETGAPKKSLSGWSLFASIPIMVQGESRGYDWSEAQVDAAGQLNRLISILSIAWGVTIDVREAAMPLELGKGLPLTWPLGSEVTISNTRQTTRISMK